FIGHELKLPTDQRKGLVRTAEATAASAARLARENASNKQNERLRNIGAKYRVDYVKADRRRKRIDLNQQCSKYIERLIELQREGWIVCFQTIILPENARPTLARSHQWGLAGSPDAQHGAKTLLDIQTAATKDIASSCLGGFWALQAHDCGQVHMHGLPAFRNQQEFDAYRNRLDASFAAHTYRLRHLKVIAGFGVSSDVKDNA